MLRLGSLEKWERWGRWRGKETTTIVCLAHTDTYRNRNPHTETCCLPANACSLLSTLQFLLLIVVVSLLILHVLLVVAVSLTRFNADRVNFYCWRQL